MWGGGYDISMVIFFYKCTSFHDKIFHTFWKQKKKKSVEQTQWIN